MCVCVCGGGCGDGPSRCARGEVSSATPLAARRCPTRARRRSPSLSTSRAGSLASRATHTRAQHADTQTRDSIPHTIIDINQASPPHPREGSRRRLSLTTKRGRDKRAHRSSAVDSDSHTPQRPPQSPILHVGFVLPARALRKRGSPRAQRGGRQRRASSSSHRHAGAPSSSILRQAGTQPEQQPRRAVNAGTALGPRS
jgi:hypothetical protein